jgi:hypothetical protein
MQGTYLLLYSLLLLAVGAVLGIVFEHLFKSLMSYKHVSVGLVAIAVFICIAVLIAPSTLPGTVRHLLSTPASAAVATTHQAQQVHVRHAHHWKHV